MVKGFGRCLAYESHPCRNPRSACAVRAAFEGYGYPFDVTPGHPQYMSTSIRNVCSRTPDKAPGMAGMGAHLPGGLWKPPALIASFAGDGCGAICGRSAYVPKLRLYDSGTAADQPAMAA